MEKNIQTICKEVLNKMEFKPTIPDYNGNGVAIWNAVDKNGKPYLKVKVLGGKIINCFSTEGKENSEKTE